MKFYIKRKNLFTMGYIRHQSACVNSSCMESLRFFFYSYITLASLLCLFNLIFNLLCEVIAPVPNQIVYFLCGWSFCRIGVPTFLQEVSIKRRCVYGNFWTKTFHY